MRIRLRHVILLTATLCLAGTGIARAQAEADQMKVAYQAARNQLGVVKYCQGKGYLDADTVSIQQKMIGLIPASDKSGGDEAEATGLKGTISAMGLTQDLEAGAKAQNTTVEKLCQAMGNAIKQAGASLPQ